MAHHKHAGKSIADLTAGASVTEVARARHERYEREPAVQVGSRIRAWQIERACDAESLRCCATLQCILWLDGGIGIRGGLKNHWEQSRVGSSPTQATNWIQPSAFPKNNTKDSVGDQSRSGAKANSL